MSSKADIRSIIKDHINTLYDLRTNKKSPWDIIFFYILPAIFSFLFYIIKLDLSDDLIKALITSMSIFSALLLNLLLIIVDKKSMSKKSKNNRFYLSTIEELYVNICYAICISIANLCLLIIYLLIKDCEIAKIVSTFFIYYLTMHFVLTLLMILKRTYIVQKEKITDSEATDTTATKG